MGSTTCIPQKLQSPKVRQWPYVLAGLILFLLGAGMSIVTLWFEQDTLAAPYVVVSTGTSTPTTEFQYGSQPHLAQSNFLTETLNAFRTNKQSFIEADLSSMKIRYHSEGAVIFEASILTKGKEGSWWETPVGLYKIETKEVKHFSSFGKVYLPSSMAFQGNFFIHGWPYYPNGTPVASQYSGGCIRLSDDDAKALYALVKVNTPVLVYEKEFQMKPFTYDTPVPQVDAEAYLIADVENGTILVQEGKRKSLPIASLTKLMTALVASEYINLDKDFVVPESAMVSTSIPRLKAGIKLSGYSLLLPLLLESSNVAANTYTHILGKERFVELMNQKAKSLGMAHTVFTDASGADSGNISTIDDLLRLAMYIHNSRSFIYKISSGEKVSTAYDVYPFGTLSNFNDVPGLEGFVGGKVGKTTAAQETIISLYRMRINGEERTIAFIALSSPNNYKAIEDMYAYMQKQYATTVISKGNLE